MITISPVAFWILLAIGFVCFVCMIITSVWYHRLTAPTHAQNKKHRLLFQLFFGGVLIFGVTPLFLWLLFFPV